MDGCPEGPAARRGCSYRRECGHQFIALGERRGEERGGWLPAVGEDVNGASDESLASKLRWRPSAPILLWRYSAEERV